VTGKVVGIYVAPQRHGHQQALTSVQVKAGKGIVGDRFFGNRKTQPGKNLTLVESEVIAEINLVFKQSLPMDATRRNIVTQNIRLNELVGRKFSIGPIVCRGVELCEPCKVMIRQLAPVNFTTLELMRFFNLRAGIRAEVVIGGIVRANDIINIFTHD
jgi:MOSC domain-containing protein YiiM